MEEKKIRLVSRKEARMLGSSAAAALREYQWRRNFMNARCMLNNDDHGPWGVQPPIIPYIDSRRSVVYYGNIKNGSYNHHSQIAYFKGKYYLSWSNGVINEEDSGQRVLIASSADGRAWSDAASVREVEKGEQIALNCVAMFAAEDKMYIFIMTEETIHDTTATGMRRLNNETSVIDILETEDGLHWKQVFSFGNRIRWIFEAPRLTRENRLMCVCTSTGRGPAVLLWPGDNVCEEPEFIYVPEPEGASFPYGEASWYQVDDGRILVFWRDEGGSCKLYVNWSDDGARSFTPPVISDIPDSMSRVYAGRLEDGRYYLCNNAIGNLLDRGPMMLLTSRDGYVFDQVWMVNDDPASMRRKGLLKTNGFQYPCCCTVDGKLVISYDANKEDILCDMIRIEDI